MATPIELPADMIRGSGAAGSQDLALQVSQLHGDYYAQNKSAKVFIQTTSILGLAIPIYTGTAPRVGLWNPAGSGCDAELLSISCQRASGTTVEFAAALFAVFNTGAGVATGAPITVFGDTAPLSGRLGSDASSRCRSTASGTITTTAGAAGDTAYALFHSYAAVSNSVCDGTPWEHNFNGRVIVPPGTMVYLAASVASVALYTTTLVWAERDI